MAGHGDPAGFRDLTGPVLFSVLDSKAMAPERQDFAERRFAQAWQATHFDRTRAARLRDLLRGRPAGLLLDVGCWDGQFSARVITRQAGEPPVGSLSTSQPADHLVASVIDGQPAGHVVGSVIGPPGEHVVGLDVSLAALQQARRRGLLPVRAQVEAPHLPFRDASFATVIAAEIIEHVFDTQAVINELARILRPGGWLALTTPNLVALSGRAQLLLGRSPHNIEYDASPGTAGHIRYFTFDTLERLLRAGGLQPLGRWTNVAHFSRFGSSELVGRLRPGLGHTLISLASKPA